MKRENIQQAALKCMREDHIQPIQLHSCLPEFLINFPSFVIQ